MKMILRITSGILASLALLLVGLRLYAISAGDKLNSATTMDILSLIFPLSIALMFGYMAYKGDMPFMDKQKPPPPDNPRPGSR
ncbi:MAG: hypothetical protein BMS9Abin26_0036 [Gammaproteobacteria bacterium]|nr:MAG: hypothetical protein BMS9Abin26_0036 [Gammaproteobacteria bacterium]